MSKVRDSSGRGGVKHLRQWGSSCWGVQKLQSRQFEFWTPVNIALAQEQEENMCPFTGGHSVGLEVVRDSIIYIFISLLEKLLHNCKVLIVEFYTKGYFTKAFYPRYLIGHYPYHSKKSIYLLRTSLTLCSRTKIGRMCLGIHTSFLVRSCQVTSRICTAARSPVSL